MRKIGNIILVLAIAVLIVAKNDNLRTKVSSITEDTVDWVNTTIDINSNSDNTNVSPTTNDNLIMSYIDVGQGDSAFIQLPNDETMLIDAGENEYGETVVSYIKDLGYQSIDYVICTHAHSDHIGGMSYVLQNLDVDNIYMTNVSTTTWTYSNLLDTIEEQDISMWEVYAGDVILDNDDLQIDIIGPQEDFDYGDNLNNSSIIVKITYNEKSFLFMGDAEKEECLSLDSNLLSADVVKLGHHGSGNATNEDFVHTVNPEYAIISCGIDNEYGHPHQNVLNVLEKANVTVYRTDTDGMIVCTCNGKEIVFNQ